MDWRIKFKLEEFVIILNNSYSEIYLCWNLGCFNKKSVPRIIYQNLAVRYKGIDELRKKKDKQ
jgi:hypothetical protein